MTDKKKILMYWLVVGVLEIISLLLAIFCIIKFVSQDNYLTGLAFFSIGICVLSGILMVFHIEKSFNWFYKKAQSAAMHAIPEFFSTSLFLLKKEKAYKRLNLIRDDNGKEIKFIQNIDISYTYKNPKTGKLEYGKPYMQEVGEYFLHINTCSYNESKYYISYVAVSLTIYIQEADTPKKIELNRKYQVNINNGEAEKFSFIAPYSMMYSVAVENANVKVFDFDSGADILNESGDKWFINKNQQVIIELSSDIENISESILITPSPEFLIIGKEYEYRLEYGEECIYKFWDNKNHDLSIKTNDKNIGVVVYNKNGNILYILNNDSYAYIADQEVYVRIYNNSEQVIEGNLVICDNIPILANQKISINVKGNETVLKTFECFEC